MANRDRIMSYFTAIHTFLCAIYDSENVEMCSTDSKAIKILQSSIPISSNKMLDFFFNSVIFSSIAFYQLLWLLTQPPRLTQHCQSYLPFHPTSLKRLWNKQTNKKKLSTKGTKIHFSLPLYYTTYCSATFLHTGKFPTSEENVATDKRQLLHWKKMS